ncbi:DUF4144 family protein [Vibrio palustris]|uniref:Uncharacterized protein n=1 Tax=Vibrio palustris TaxID=1918946 RepID=A0A1R4B296_9VIBR|nr:DUF4144 family protein [Vibrio palustris]SJL83035.1 hypothetical protein VPAL9027_00983 [Vibrio palustris]
MVTWPCLLKLEGDAELIFIASYTALLDECEALILSQNDCIIDSVGKSYYLRTSKGRTVELEPQKRFYTLEKITELIQKHEFSKAQMCIMKIQFPTIESAVSALQ